MFELVHESWFSLVVTAAGLAATLTKGRRIERPASVAAAWAVAALAGGMLGMALGQQKVDAAFRRMSELDLATRVKILSVGTREATANLLFGAGCALLLLAVGTALALIGVKTK
jgi:hypothetical protein